MPEIKITHRRDSWTMGTIGDFYFEVKHFYDPSIFGIDEGRISKLWLTWANTYGTIAVYDRGWDKLPTFKEAQDAIDALCALWN